MVSVVDETQRLVEDNWSEVPLFPLPDYVLFPHTLVPFHVFEPRYVNMLDDCLAGSRLVVIVGMQPGWELNPEASADTYEVGGIGRIVSDRRLRNGRTNIFVHCIERIQIVRRYEGDSYTSVDVQPLLDRAPGTEAAALSQARDRLVSLGANLARELGPDGGALSKVLGSTGDPTVLTHRLASMVVPEPTERQNLLELRSPLVRCHRLADHLTQLLMERLPSPGEPTEWIN
jgi:Lon protease-like protein